MAGARGATYDTDMNARPIRLQLTDEGGLRIDWSDGASRVYSARELYAVNPAADAKAEREKKQADVDAELEASRGRAPGKAKVGNLMLSVIKPEEAQERRVVGVKPVGNYAYGIQFNFGSSQGLYRLPLLRQIGTPANEEASPATADVVEERP